MAVAMRRMPAEASGERLLAGAVCGAMVWSNKVSIHVDQYNYAGERNKPKRFDSRGRARLLIAGILSLRHGVFAPTKATRHPQLPSTSYIRDPPPVH